MRTLHPVYADLSIEHDARAWIGIFEFVRVAARSQSVFAGRDTRTSVHRRHDGESLVLRVKFWFFFYVFHRTATTTTAWPIRYDYFSFRSRPSLSEAHVARTALLSRVLMYDTMCVHVRGQNAAADPLRGTSVCCRSCRRLRRKKRVVFSRREPKMTHQHYYYCYVVS